ncbi:MAG: hypothetical protein R2795_01020 [Saprospiraceae bacterium]
MRTLLIFLSLTLFIFSCDRDESPEKVEQLTDLTLQLPLSQQGLLLEEVALDESLTLPTGTKVTQAKDNLETIYFELPATHLFLTTNTATGQSGTTRYGGYSCTCDGRTGSCAAFSAGGQFGCLHNSCSGNCVGTVKPSGGNTLTGSPDVIVGVLDMADDVLKAGFSQGAASLNEQGLDAFFKIAEVARQIEEQYGFAYHKFPAINMESLAADAPAPSGHLFLPVHMYGIHFLMLIPASENSLELFPEYALAKSGTPTCEGSNGCSCSLKKQCFFGNCIWTCSGCKTCTIGDPNE